MTILGIDTATERLSAALRVNGKEFSRHKDARTAHCELLTGFIGELLDEAGITSNDVEGVAVSTGPGSFTGLRIGIATAMGFAYGLGLKAAPINSIMGLAGNYQKEGILVCPLIDAKRGEVYCGIYRPGSDTDMLEEILAPSAMPLDDIVNKTKSIEETVIFAGPASLTFRDRILDLSPDAAFINPAQAPASALSSARLGETAFKRNETIAPAAIKALYIRRSDAEIARCKNKSRQGRKSS